MTTDVERIQAHLGSLPIFPLPTAVLLPYEILPLHVFEPRYKEMIADVIENERPLAIVQLASGWEGDYERRPPVEPLCGAGVLVRHERLADGRYNVLVKGIARVEIVKELASRRLYREVSARLAPDSQTPATPREVAGAMESLRRMLFALCASRPGPAASALAQLAIRAPDAGALADIVAAALLTDFERRKRSLVTLDPVERLSIAQTAIAELLVKGNPESEVRFRN
jgi:Lon protease-like protein